MVHRRLRWGAAGIAVALVAGCGATGAGRPSTTPPPVISAEPSVQATFAKRYHTAYDRLRASGVASLALGAMPHAHAAHFPGVDVVGDLSGRRLADVADRASQAVSDVDGLTGGRFSGLLLVLAPATAKEFSSIYGSTSIADIQGDTVFQKGRSTYIVCNSGRRIDVVGGPGATTSMAQVDSSTVSRDVLTHEVFHALTLTYAARRDLPLWLTEGFAEWAGSTFSGVPLTPTATHAFLPSDRDLSDDRAVDAYQLAASFVAYLVTTYGKVKAMVFYRAAVASPQSSVDLAARRELGHSVRELVGGWTQTYRRSH